MCVLRQPVSVWPSHGHGADALVDERGMLILAFLASALGKQWLKSGVLLGIRMHVHQVPHPELCALND